MSVVGFDFGNESCRVAVVRRGAVEVLQNDIGNRNTAAMVGFTRTHRLLGDAAAPQYKSNYLNTIIYPKRVLGQDLNDSFAKTDGSYLPYKLIKGQDGSPSVEVSYNQGTHQLSMVQVTAALLGQLKRTAEHGLGQAVKDCVIGVPSYWTEKQKLAMLDAAQVAGLHVMQLMHETTAVALNYGILRPLPKDTTVKVLFVDVGLCSTNVALVAFQQGKLQVLSTASDQNLGGRSFDDVLVQHFAKHIQTTYKMDVLSNQKATMKLKDECLRIKKVLSANSTVKFNVEYIMNDKDVTGMIQREEFEKACAPLVARLRAPIEQALAKANTTKEEIHSIEIVGGATRIPMVKKVFNDFFGKEVSQTCDADESIARGCALMCAILSPSVKVKAFEVTDTVPYSIEVCWGKDKEETAEMFKAHPLGTTRSVTLKNKNTPFQVTAKEVGGLSANPDLGRWTVTGFPQGTPGASAPKVSVHVKLDSNGIVGVPSVLWKEVLAIDEKDKKEDKKEDGKKEEKKEEKKDDKKPEEKADDKKAEDAPKEDGKKEDGKKEEAKKEEPKKATKQSREVELTIAEDKPGRLDAKLVQQYKDKEAEMTKLDALVRETNEARNLVEAYALETQSKLDGEWSQYATSAVKEDFGRLLMNTEDWINDGNHSKEDYKAKLAELKAVGDPIQRRCNETAQRPELIGELNRAIAESIALATSTDPKYSHIKAEEKDKVVANSKEAEAWLAKELKKQEAQPFTEDPVLTCEALEKRRIQVQNHAKSVMNEPPPAPPKEEKKEEAKEEKKDDKPAGDKKPEEKKEEAKQEKKEEEKKAPESKPKSPAADKKPAEKKQKKNSATPSKKKDGAVPMDTTN